MTSSTSGGAEPGTGAGRGMEARIREKVVARLDPLFLDVVNESHKHSVPPGSETHWNLVVVSSAFAGQRLVGRHRLVYEALGDELRSGIHALALKTLSPMEWGPGAASTENPSPPCLGGSKAKPD